MFCRYTQVNFILFFITFVQRNLEKAPTTQDYWYNLNK